MNENRNDRDKILIVGGAYQGKVSFFREHYGLAEEKEMDFKDFAERRKQSPLQREEAMNWLKQVGESPVTNFYHCEQLLHYAVMWDLTAEIVWKEIFAHRQKWCIIMNEVGNGIIPLQEQERKYREEAGKFGCLAAKHAQEVVRVICGFGQRIKGE